MTMHSLLAIVAIAIASNLDNAGVGIAYGVQKIKISWLSNTVIAVMGFLMTLVAGFFGNWLSLWITPFTGKMIGMIVLVLIGLWVLCQPLFGKKQVEHEAQPLPTKQPSRSHFIRILQNPEDADFDHSHTISFGEAVILGIALSINNLAGGFDAGLTSLNIWSTSLFSGLFSYICVGLCAYLGARYAADRLGKWATVIAGLLLILVGIHQMV